MISAQGETTMVQKSIWVPNIFVWILIFEKSRFQKVIWIYMSSIYYYCNNLLLKIDEL